MRKLIHTLALVIVFSSVSIIMAQTNHLASDKLPAAKKITKTSTIHSETRVDNYFWLREKTNPEVISYLESENAYTNTMMKSTEAFQETLYKEILSRIKETDLSVPYRESGYYYYSRTEQGKQYQILCRKRGDLNANEEIILDLNELAKGNKFLALGSSQVSPDGNLLAYSLDTSGFRQYTLYVKDLRTGQLLPDRIENSSYAVWANDCKTFFYVTEDHAKRPYRLYRHTLGKSGDELIYEEKDELFRLSVYATKSRAYIIFSVSSFTASETHYLSADRPYDTFKVLLPREAEHRYYVNHHGESFYIRTNQGAKNFRLVSAPVRDPGKENWKEVVPHRKDITLEGVDLFINHYVLFEREDGLVRIRITDLRNGQTHRVDFPEPVYAAFANANPEFNTNIFRFSYQSFVTPSSVFDYNMDTRSRELLKQTEVLGGYDASLYQSERIYATAQDGTRVPISLVYRKDLKRDGTRPMLLNGYGSYGASIPVTFSLTRLSLLNRGVIYAHAHVRGGGDLGEEWHDQGKMLNKRNTFTDFIAAAEHLIGEKYTAKDRLVIEGTSAGGLLMGAVVNLRPDLFKAVIARVPFVDVINTMLDASLPLTVGEYQEWGNPNIKAEYDYMKSYCPYTNLAAKDYPAMLVKTSLNDSQVMYWEPAKYVARLRELKTDKNPLLFKVNMAAGHGGASGRYDALRDNAFDYAFILTQLGINQ
ncbi:MAG: S9 family peptidase [Acidobacteriota bacterium]